MEDLKIVQLPTNVRNYKLASFDPGVFALELLNLKVTETPKIVGDVPKPLPETTDANPLDEGVREGTVQGTQLALTQMFNMIDERYKTYFDVVGFESVIPRKDSLKKKREQLYIWDSDPKNRYPPHLNKRPWSEDYWAFQIFDALALAQVTTLVPRVMPRKSFLGFSPGTIVDRLRFNAFGNPEAAHVKTLKDIWEFNKTQRAKKASAYQEPNIGDRADWFSDAVFAQQQFTGANPTTLTAINLNPKKGLLEEFIKAAKDQKLKDVEKLLVSTKPGDLYVQDCSYFREAIGMTDPHGEIKTDNNAGAPGEFRYAIAPVTLFHLTDAGKLHPLAIVIDYKETMAKSVCLFNKRLAPSPTGRMPADEEHDWPWRYAKTCSQIADWMRHEIIVHLTNTHLVEEAMIVATQRSFEWDHVVLKILYPHWYKTLALNASARETLVPNIIMDLVGFSEEESFNFINWHYRNFDWRANYVPADLKRRGFPVDKLNTNKYRNYGYARNIHPLWQGIHVFVKDMLSLYYKDDAAVANDQTLKNWITEVRGDKMANIKSFPSEFKGLEDLADALTMCIHLASPQHTAVNYLQQYYQSFVINKPSALCQKPPSKLSELTAYTEKHLFDALPVMRPREWLLLSHLPYLLSERVESKQSLAGYVVSLYDIYRKKRVEEDENAPKITQFAASFYSRLVEFDNSITVMNKEMDDPTFPYTVLDPDNTAVSILI